MIRDPHPRPEGQTYPSRGFQLVIDGAPAGKGRPRHGNGRTWTPKETVLAEQEIRRAWEEAGSPRIDGPVRLIVELRVTRAKDHYRADGVMLSAKGERFPLPTGKKPDVDNALKLVMDSLNGRAYRDDVDVVIATVMRFWSRDGWPRTIVEVRPLILPPARPEEMAA